MGYKDSYELALLEVESDVRKAIIVVDKHRYTKKSEMFDILKDGSFYDVITAIDESIAHYQGG